MGGDIGEIKLGSERELYKYINHYVVVKRDKEVSLLMFKKNLNASKPSEHPPQVEECLKV